MLHLETEVVSSFQELKDYLYNLANEHDNDYNGDNGKDYLWDEAEECGYDSNLNYVTEYILDNKDYSTGILGLNQYCVDFLYYWMERDNFYKNFEFDIKEVYGKYVVAISWETGNE